MWGCQLLKVYEGNNIVLQAILRISTSLKEIILNKNKFSFFFFFIRIFNGSSHCGTFGFLIGKHYLFSFLNKNIVFSKHQVHGG